MPRANENIESGVIYVGSSPTPSLPPLPVSTPSLNGLPTELKFIIISRVQAQDAAYQARKKVTLGRNRLYGKGLDSLSRVNREFRKLTLKMIFSRLTIDKFKPFPKSNSSPHLPDPRDYVESGRLSEGMLVDHLKTFSHSLVNMGNLRELDLRDNNETLIATLADVPEADSGDNHRAPEGGFTGERTSIYVRQPSIRRLMELAQQSCPKIFRRLTAISLGIAQHEDQIPFLLEEDLGSKKLKKLSIGQIEGTFCPVYQSYLFKHPSERLLAAINRFRNLEELKIGSRDGLGVEFGNTPWRFAASLRRLTLYIPKIDKNLVTFIWQFIRLEELRLDLVSAEATVSSDSGRMELPNLKHLHLSIQKLDISLSRILSIFDPLPDLRNVTLGIDSENDYELKETLQVSDLESLLLPFSNTKTFPSLETITFPFPASSLESCSFIEPAQLIATRPLLDIVFAPEHPASEMTPFVKLENELYPRLADADERRKDHHEDMEQILEWGLRELRDMKSERRNRDGVGATEEAAEMLKTLEGLYELKRRKED